MSFYHCPGYEVYPKPLLYPLLCTTYGRGIMHVLKPTVHDIVSSPSPRTIPQHPTELWSHEMILDNKVITPHSSGWSWEDNSAAINISSRDASIKRHASSVKAHAIRVKWWPLERFFLGLPPFLCLHTAKSGSLTHSPVGDLKMVLGAMKWSLFETFSLIYFMKLYTNLIQTKTMSVTVSLHKARLGQSWQAKSIFRVPGGDNTHTFAGRLARSLAYLWNCDFKH